MGLETRTPALQLGELFGKVQEVWPVGGSRSLEAGVESKNALPTSCLLFVPAV